MDRLIAFALLAVLLGACSTGPYAVLDTRARLADDPLNQRVFIRGLDGKLLIEAAELELTPGRHELRLRSHADAVGEVPFNGFPVEFDAKPCTRQYITAQHEDPPGRRWVPRVIREEPIEDCP